MQRFVIVLFAILHVVLVAQVIRLATSPSETGRAGYDFRAYYFGAQVAEHGGDPYDPEQLVPWAEDANIESELYPFLYPPAFLLVMKPLTSWDWFSSFCLWMFVNELSLLGCAAILAIWWRSLQPQVGVLILVFLSLNLVHLDGILYGQVGSTLLALTLGGLWLTSRGHGIAGGVLLGTATAMKLLPGIFILWWLMHRRWRAAGSAIVVAALWSLAAVLVYGWPLTERFLTEVLPALGRGDYFGIKIAVDSMLNFSIASWTEQLAPSPGIGASKAAILLAKAMSFVLLIALAWSFRRRPLSTAQEAAQMATLALASQLFPVYAWDHYLIWAYPALVLTGVAIWRRHWSMPVSILVALGIAVTVLPASTYYLPAQDGSDHHIELLVGNVKRIGILTVLIATWALAIRPLECTRTETKGAEKHRAESS